MEHPSENVELVRPPVADQLIIEEPSENDVELVQLPPPPVICRDQGEIEKEYLERREKMLV